MHLSSILLQSSKAYSLPQVSKAQEPLVFRASPGQGSHCRGQQSPNLAESAKKICFIPAQPLMARGSQPHRGFKSFPESKKALASELCGTASQTPFQSTKQREERVFFALFYLHSLLRGCLFAGAHQHLALYHCYM